MPWSASTGLVEQRLGVAAKPDGLGMTEGVLGEVDGGSILEQLGATLLGQNQRHGFE